MAKDTFQLDISGAGQEILQGLAGSIVAQAAHAIQDRAGRMASSLSSDAPSFEVYTSIGTIKNGRRAIATVKANQVKNAHQAFVAHQALAKAKDAGRV